MKPTATHDPEKQYIKVTQNGKTRYLSYRKKDHLPFLFLGLHKLGLTKEDIIICSGWDELADKLQEHLDKPRWTELERDGPHRKNKSWESPS